MVSTSTTKTKKNVDMSTKVGGRIFRPALPVVDGNTPTKLEVGFQSTLDEYSNANIPIENTTGIQTRERVLNKMGVLCREWIQSVCKEKGLPSDIIENAGGSLFTSGSYRLGVHEPGADIDTILVAPAMCHRQDFFGTSKITTTIDNEQKRDPNSLAERIRRHPDVTNFVPVEGAAVPILTFDWEGINIDLLFARINSNSVSASNFDIDNDTVLDGADSATEKSLNGPRVTNLIAALVSGTPQRYQTFLQVVRCVRKWAKARGLYSNKMGYWGGVNINIAVALTCQLYPNACAASLLRKFFLVFKTWRWPQPVMLVKPHDSGYGLPVWNAQTSQRQIAPMITPAYPAMNSTLSVSRQTLQILQFEFERGHAIVDQLWKDYNKDPSNSPSDLHWSKLFEPSDFFIAYPHYLSLCIVGPSQTDAQAWSGFVESRLRKLVSDLLGRSLPLRKIQLWPKKVEACVADRTAILTLAQRQNSSTYFVGFQIDKLRMRGRELNVELPLQNFREWELARFQPLVTGMDILAKVFKVKELPKICFDGMYEGGKEEAMKKRRRLRDEDPERQEKRRLKRLEEIKAKMAELQRKKEEREDKNSNKRKIEEVELEDATSELVKEEKEVIEEDAVAGAEGEDDEDAPAAEVEEIEETNLLESALDTVLDDTGGEVKTREEAEADRRKLLAGEMLHGTEGTGDDIIGQGGNLVESDDEDEYGYSTGDRGRHSLLMKLGNKEQQQQQLKDKRMLPVSEEEAEVLRKLGYSIVSDDENKVLGANMIPPWQAGDTTQQEDDEALPTPSSMKIKFLTKFDIVELDANGRVIDRGDENFSPSLNWDGRKAGFEFKLGDRGLGYYRTGAKVVVPSNTTY